MTDLPSDVGFWAEMPGPSSHVLVEFPQGDEDCIHQKIRRNKPIGVIGSFAANYYTPIDAMNPNEPFVNRHGKLQRQTMILDDGVQAQYKRGIQ